MNTAHITNTGKRENNEDSVLVRRLDDDVYLLAVADGLGGHSAGETASRLAVIELEETVKKAVEEGVTDFKTILQNAFEKAGREISRLGRENVEYQGMGTTLVAALIKDGRGIVANVGDSRAYLLGSEIRQVTTDHSLVQELVDRLVDRKVISKEEAFQHPQGNIVTKVLETENTEGEVQPDFYEVELSDNLLLLCSDGLSDVLKDEEIRDIVLKSSSLKEACDLLVNEALKKGGRDNITVILARER